MATVIVVIAPAIAETLSDPETGLSVTLPSGLSLSKTNSMKDNLRILLTSRGVTNSDCTITYSKSKWSSDPNMQNWHDRFEKYSVQEMALTAGRRGILDTPSFDENYPLGRPAKPSSGRMLSVDFKTSNGYLFVNCRAAEKDVDKLRPMLDSLIRGITLPN